MINMPSNRYIPQNPIDAGDLSNIYIFNGNDSAGTLLQQLNNLYIETSSEAETPNSSTPLTTTSSIPDIKIDTRLPYRYGYPTLPILPLITIRNNIPSAFSLFGPHLAKIRGILQTYRVSVEKLEVAHRVHVGISPSASTLTLCVSSHEENNATWEAAIYGVHDYLTTTNPPAPQITIEIIDSRVFHHGIYTLPLLPTETKELKRAIKRRTPAVEKIIQDEGLHFSSICFYYRGLQPRWKSCKPTCIISIPENESERVEWWDIVVPKVQKALGKHIPAVEIVFSPPLEQLKGAGKWKKARRKRTRVIDGRVW